MQQLINSDTDQIFQDWGRPATLEEVQAFYDPATGQMEESIVATSLTLISGTLASYRHAQTTGTHPDSEQLFIVKAAEIPESIDLLTARVVIENRSFQIQSIVISHIPDTVALHCKSLDE